ncbi:MAG: peptidylprolyl isomerase [Bdellovibrionota bacterium]|nr:peptidylprolyl isomerase [Bdellovibrionota bacterium]
MYSKLSFFFLFFFFTQLSFVTAQVQQKSTKSSDEDLKERLLTKFKKFKKLEAEILTNYGNIKVQLFPAQAPITVDNFIDLAEGKKEFVDVGVEGQEKVVRPYYDGLKIHRISPNFIIQMGCPLGNGTSGPGYTLPVEPSLLRSFDAPGMLAMAKRDGRSDGGQFFITLVPAKFLDESYSIFGKVTEGMDVVQTIGKVPTLPNERPKKKILITNIKINRTLRK